MNDRALVEHQAFYDRMWAERPTILNRHEAHRLARIMEAMIPVVEARRSSEFHICDLGCGVGWLSNALRLFGQVTGVDISPQGIDLAKERWPLVNFEVANILQYSPSQKFDLVVCSEVIEHIHNKEALIDQVVSILKPSGFFVVTCPNGKAQRSFEEGLPSNQPVEEWPAPSELERLISGKMRILNHSTFYIDYSHVGPMRLVNSYKVRQFLGAGRLNKPFDALCGKLNLGLYQILLAQKQT